MATTTSAHRSGEWLAAFMLSLLTLPLVVAVAATSVAVYRRSPFFVHQRIGRHGRPIPFVKLRTLPPETNPYVDKHALRAARVPWVMQLVRRVHLDEIPQLWLVLTGHLSLVGPRAEMAVLHQRIPAEAAAERLAVRPGVTGLWQISAHCDGLICDRVEYDRLYVQHRSARLDLWILWRTVKKVVYGHRVHLFEVPRWAIGPRLAPPTAPVPSTADPIIDLTADAASLAVSSEASPAVAG